MSDGRIVAVAGLFHETHTFVSGTTPLADFQRRGGDELLAARCDGSPLDGFLEVAERRGWRVVPTVDMRASPSATADDAVLEAFWDGFVAGLREAPPPDAIFLVLHGAMVTTSTSDVEGEVLSRIAARYGPDRPPVFGVFDLHANLGPDTVRHAEGLVAYRENPHTDAREAAVLASELLARCLDEGQRPQMRLASLRIVWPPTGTGTADAPMASLQALARRLESEAEAIWAINVVPGYAYADTPHTGLSISAIGTDTAELDLALDRLSEAAWPLRHEGLPPEREPEALMAEILPVKRKPVILTEPSDNIGGGAPGDATGLLRVLLRHAVPSALVVLNDPPAVEKLAAVPLGATTRLGLGGRGSSFDEGALRLEVQLLGLTDGRFELEDPQSHLASMYGRMIEMGPSAVVRHAGITLLITTRKTPPFDLGQLRSQGLEPADFDLIVVKAAVAHRRAYDTIAAATYAVATPGTCPSDLTTLAYKRLLRPSFPLDPGLSVRNFVRSRSN
jgi:microcystin degradation protein MlrC